jgi:hypothetical protein
LATLYSSIDAVTEPFDSRLFAGGRPTMAAFTTDNKLGYFTGQNMAATLETGDIAFDDVNRTFVSSVRALTDAGSFTVADGVCANHNDTAVFSADQSPNSRSKLCNFRSDGRLHRMRTKIPAGTDWSTITGLDVEAVVTGSV